MFKRIFSWLLVLALLLGMTGNVLAAESKPAVSQIVTMQNQEGVTVRLTVPGGAGSGNGRLVYQFPKELTLKGAKSLVGSEGISNLGTSDTSVSFAWTCYEDYAAETAILELSFAGAVGVYQGSITLPEQDHETIPVTIPIEEPYRYVDVTNEKVWYFPYVYAAHDAGLMNGMGQDRFVPEGHLTRAQMAMLLYRMAGTPGVQGENPFTDVRTGKWYTNAVLWAAEHEIVYGYGDGRFRPDGDITRQEAVTMLARFAALQEVELKKTVEPRIFTDEAKISGWAKEAVKLCTEAGILEGYPDGSFRPWNLITRAEAAKIIVIFHGLFQKTPDKPNPPDPTDPPDPTAPTDPPESYTVTFVGDQGYAKVDGKKVESVTLEPGRTWLNFSLFGDKTVGYELDDVQVTSGTLSRNGSAFVLKDIHEDVTVSFSTKDMVLTVNFVSAQTAVIEPASVQIPWGQTVEEPVATRTGYEVTGWYTEPALEHLFDFTKPVYESITLYAKWGVKHFTVNFWDGETLLYTQQVRYNARVERPADPQKEGYLFVGWYTDPALTDAYSFLRATTSDLDLYAMWREDDRADYVYLGANDTQYPAYGVCGDDANDGSSMEQAVRTFERAKELLKDAKNPVIILCGKVPITQDTTWSMADLPNGKVVRNTGLTTYLIDVQNEATLTLDHIIIDGGGEMFPDLQTGSACGAMLYLESGTELVLNEGTVVQNCVHGSTTAAIYANSNCKVTVNDGVRIVNNDGAFTGGIIAGAGCEITINGGEFSGNRQTGTAASYSCYGSALSVGSSTSATLTINGGVFTDNHATVGATIGALQSVVFNMNGGTVTGNTSGAVTGGISIGYASTSYTGNGTLYLTGGTVQDNTGAEETGSPQIYAMRSGQVVLNSAKDAVEIGEIYVDDYNGAYGIYAAKPISNVKGGTLQVAFSDIDVNTVLLRGYNTYKITQVDVAAYRLRNDLDPYFKAVMDTDNGIYHVVSNQKIGTAVYLSSPTQKVNPGNDENDGLTPETPVATFDRAKAILAANAKAEGENVIYVMNAIPVGEGETVTLSLEGIPNGALMRYESNTSYFFNVSGGTIVTENIVIDGNSPYVPRSKTSGAIFSVSKGGSITTKSGTVVQHVRSSTHSVIYLSSTAGATATATIEDLTVTGLDTYSTSNTAYSGASIFYVTGAGQCTLTVNGGTFTDNEARLLYLIGAGAHQVNINDCTFSNNHLGYSGAVFALYNSAESAAEVNFNGGTFTNNRSTGTTATLGGGGIGYVQSGATVRLKGGDFSGNSSAAGSQYDGLFLKPYNKNLTAEVHIAKLNQDLTVWTNQTSKTVNNTWLVLESPLTHKVILNDSYRIADTIVVKGTDSYTLTESDLANLIPGDDAIAFYLDAENNAIRIRTVE